MQAYSLDYLLAEVNTVIRRPSPQELYLKVKHSVRDVYAKVGYELLADSKCKTMAIREGKIRLGSDILTVTQVYDGDFNEGEEVEPHSGRNPSGRKMPFDQTPLELKFFNKKSGVVLVCYWGLYLNDLNEPIIPEAVYSACLNTAIAELLKTVPLDHPNFKERMNYKNEADTAVFEARGLLNGNTRAKNLNTLRYF